MKSLKNKIRKETNNSRKSLKNTNSEKNNLFKKMIILIPNYQINRTK